MEKAICAIPVQCRKCGELFDLSYDLEGIPDERIVAEVMRVASRNSRALLCWNCRLAR